MKPAGPLGPASGLEPEKLYGIVVDDKEAEKSGEWTEGTGLKGYVGYGYVYSSDQKATIRFPFQIPTAGQFDVRVSYLPHENRGKRVRVVLTIDGQATETTIDMTKAAPLENAFMSLGIVNAKPGSKGSVEFFAKGAGGNVHADAVQIVPATKSTK